MIDLSQAAIVVAHPDDEVLWFSSLIGQVGSIVLCYGADPDVFVGERAQQRREVVQRLPLDNVVHLDVSGPSWDGRRLGPVEDEQRRLANEDPALRLVLEVPLRRALAGASTVFVHNPWGEYGHDDHRRVNSVVNALRTELNFDVFVSSYVERRALHLMQATLERGVAETISYPVSRDVIDPIVEVYKAGSCWTWYDDWTWPKEEAFLRLGRAKSQRPFPAPVQFFSK
jgi:LmbE family N-acetylglucosaminyl deacetylase